MIDIINASEIYSGTAYNLLVWAKEHKNRIKANKLIKIAERIENKFRNKHKTIFGQVWGYSAINPLQLDGEYPICPFVL